MIINNRKSKETAPERRHGLSDFEEFEGSERTHKVTDDIYAPENYLTTKEYGVPSCLLNFEANLDRTLQEFFSQAKPDEFNSSFIDATIRRLEAESLASLDIQRNEHRNSGIPGILMAWHRGETDFKEMKKRINRELDEVEEDLQEYLRIFYKGTSLENRYQSFHFTNRKEN